MFKILYKPRKFFTDWFKSFVQHCIREYQQYVLGEICRFKKKRKNPPQTYLREAEFLDFRIYFYSSSHFKWFTKNNFFFFLKISQPCPFKSYTQIPIILLHEKDNRDISKCYRSDIIRPSRTIFAEHFDRIKFDRSKRVTRLGFLFFILKNQFV